MQNFLNIVEDERKARIFWSIMAIVNGIISFVLWFSHSQNETLMASAPVFLLGAIAAIIALAIVAFAGETLAGFIATGIYAIALTIIGVFMLFLGNFAITLALALIIGGIALTIAIPKHKVVWAIVGWILFGFGLFIIQTIF